MFDVRVAAGGREVNTAAEMASVTVMMMIKFLSSLADLSAAFGGRGVVKWEDAG